MKITIDITIIIRYIIITDVLKANYNLKGFKMQIKNSWLPINKKIKFFIISNQNSIAIIAIIITCILIGN